MPMPATPNPPPRMESAFRFRASEEERESIRRVAATRGLTASDLVRRALIAQGVKLAT